MYVLPAPRFFRLASRLSAYAGVMQARVAALLEEGSPTTAPGTKPTGPRSDTYVPKPVTPESVALDPLLASLISVGTSE